MLFNLIDHISITKWWIKMFVSLILYIFVHEPLCSFCNQIYPFDYRTIQRNLVMNMPCSSRITTKETDLNSWFVSLLNEIVRIKHIIPMGRHFILVQCVLLLCDVVLQFDMFYINMKDFGQASVQLLLFSSTVID